MSKKQTFHIAGMTCTSCEVIIERKVKRIEGVESVNVSSGAGTCTVSSKKRLDKEELKELLKDTEYEIVKEGEKTKGPFDWWHLVKISATIVVIYALVSWLGIFSFDAQIDESLSYGSIFVIGLIASVSSCIAVVGGLVLTFTATVKRSNPSASKWELLRAHLFFNGGRLLSYFLFGGLVGVLGTALAPSPRIMGVFSLFVAFIMIVLALDLLGLSGSKRWIPRMPKKFSHWIHDMAERKEWWIPALLGALTFILPCGFTQSMQLYALTTGSFFEGAMTLFVFALGTLPALLGIGALASFTSSKGRAYRWFMLIAGSIVLLLGLYNAKNAMTLMGVNTNLFSQSSTQEASAGEFENGIQVVEMAVDGIDYIPAKITLQKDVPVKWVIDGSGATGCTSVIAVPSLRVSERLSQAKETIIEFTPTKTGKIPFTCGMGMAYGEFNVVDALPEKEPCDDSYQTCSS